MTDEVQLDEDVVIGEVVPDHPAAELPDDPAAAIEAAALAADAWVTMASESG